MRLRLLLLAGLLSCKTDSKSVPEPEPEPTSTLSTAELTRRLSYDLRGIPPTPAELARAESDGAWALRDEFLADPLFEERLVHLFAQTWHTRVDVFDIIPLDYGLDPVLEYDFERAVGEEPLRIVARVVSEDRPWSEVVTADWTMAEDILLSVWPLDADGEGPGWREAHYTDARPSAGVLATNGLWWRYTTTTSNINRARAAAISRLLLCENYLVRPVAFSAADLSDTTTEDAAQNNPYCLACHASLDPVAASLFGFWWLSLYSEIEETTYHPEREALWDQTLGVEPAWYGEPISGLPDLGAAVAGDNRFYAFAVETFAEGLWQRDTTNDDMAELERLRRAFLEAGASPLTLVKAITESDAYAEPTERMLTHDQLRSSLHALTGFRWEIDSRDLLDSDESGFRLLLGGVDGVALTSPQREPGLTWALGVKRASEAAAAHVVAADLLDTRDGVLFSEVDLSHRPGDAAFTRELGSLHQRMYGTEASAEWTTDIEALWSAVESEDGAARAWEAVVSVMLRDPAFLAY